MAKKQTTIADAVEETTAPAEETKDVQVIDQQKDVVPATESFDENSALDAYEDDDENQTIPNLIVVQKTHDDYSDHMGSLFSPELDLPFEKMRCSVLVRWDSRVMFPEKFKADNDPLCRSLDGKHPATDIVDSEGNKIVPLGPSCGWNKATLHHDCPYANWSDNEPPRCKEVVNLVVLDLESDMPFRISFSSTSLKPFKEFSKKLGYRKMALTSKRKREGLPKSRDFMFEFILAVNPEARKGDGGSSNLPMFTDIKEVEGDNIEHNSIWANGVIPYVEMMRTERPQIEAGTAPTGEIAGEVDDFAG